MPTNRWRHSDQATSVAEVGKVMSSDAENVIIVGYSAYSTDDLELKEKRSWWLIIDEKCIHQETEWYGSEIIDLYFMLDGRFEELLLVPFDTLVNGGR